MVQALLEDRRRGSGTLIQFSAKSSDGAREATWTQPATHPDYTPPLSEPADTPREWIFQVKYHDIGLRGWKGAADAVISDLKSELAKITTKYKHKCHSYVLMTNVPLTGGRHVGSRDRVSSLAAEWKSRNLEVQVWDAANLSSMIDANSRVRAAYSDTILPGDIIHAIYMSLQREDARRANMIRAYLSFVSNSEARARADEAGDEDHLSLASVFIDPTLSLSSKQMPVEAREAIASWRDTYGNEDSLLPGDLTQVRSSFLLLTAALEKVMLVAGPGYGKSTITQFLSLYHASRILKALPETQVGLGLVRKVLVMNRVIC